MERFSIIALLALVTLATASNNDLTIGEREKGDMLVAEDAIHHDPFWFWLVKKEYQTYSSNGKYVITCVDLIDLRRDSDSAKAEIVNGGPGYTYVNIMFESMPGREIDFYVKIYGKSP